MDLSAQIALRKWCELLEKHGGRDKVIRVTGYICTFISDLPVSNIFQTSSHSIINCNHYLQGMRDTPLSKKLVLVGRQMSYCRTVLRLFDDLPMLNRTLSYGLGSSEKDQIIRLSNVLSIIVNTFYYPLEHIAWAGDQKVATIGNGPI
jgi:peroxin-11C